MFLAIDSSQPRLWVALGMPGDAFEMHAADELSHSEELTNLVGQLLHQRGLGVRDLSAVLIGSGPGSFTGLRIGYSFAKGFCLAANLNLIEVPTFDAIAAEFIGKGSPVNVVADARRGEVFLGCYADGVNTATPMIVPLERLLACDGTMVCSCAREAQSLGLKGALIPKCPASAMIMLGADKLTANRVIDAADLAEITPFYLRSVAAKTIAERT